MEERIKDLLEVLKGERRRQGISQRELVEQTGVGIHKLWEMEQDRYTSIDVFTLDKICQGLGFHLTIDISRKVD